ncbi:MAG: hypothetical protein QM690_11605 [Sphingobium sp.]
MKAATLRIWIKVDFTRDASVDVRSGMEKWEIDCEQSRKRILTATYYTADGFVNAAFAFDDRWRDIKAPSVEATIEKLLCAR